MLYSIKNRKDLEKSEEVASLQDQAEERRLPNKLGKQNFQEKLKNLYKPLTDTIDNISENLTKTFTETSI